MIEFIVLIILIIAFAFLIYPLVTLPSFFINISLLIIIAIRAGKDLKENKMHVYYMAASFLAVILFVAREYGFLRPVFDFLFNTKIFYYTQAAIAIFILAHIIGFSHSTIKDYIKHLKSRRSV